MLIRVSEMVPLSETLPIKELQPRTWHFRRCYSRRINKKWLRRWGHVVRELSGILIMNDPMTGQKVAVMHPKAFDAFKKSIPPAKPTFLATHTVLL